MLVPLVVAVLGKDYYIPRALIPAWIPLVVVIGAACTAPRLRIPGGILAGVLLTGFVLAQVKISGDPQYQRPDWRGVAQALGAPSGTRAIIADDGTLATDPLITYVHGIRGPSRPVRSTLARWTSSATPGRCSTIRCRPGSRSSGQSA